MIREIVKIDEELCNGCGLCIPNCHEGALQIIDNKARLVSDLLCDGLGACLGHCPEGAISIEKREAEEYNETTVMADMVKKGKNTVIAHLKHLKEHNEKEFLQEGVQYMIDHKEELDFNADEVMRAVHHEHQNNTGGSACGCAGSAERTFGDTPHNQHAQAETNQGSLDSALTHWPIQMHLINPAANHFRKSDLVLAADCVAFSLGSFHPEYLKGKTLAIACPKLDQGLEIYIDKIRRLIDEAQINTITVIRMEVPCCGGLLQLVRAALQETQRKIPVKAIVVSADGRILSEEWV